MNLIRNLFIIVSITLLSIGSAQTFWTGSSIAVGGGGEFSLNDLWFDGVQGYIGQEDILSDIDGRLDFKLAVSHSDLAGGSKEEDIEVLEFHAGANALWHWQGTQFIKDTEDLDDIDTAFTPYLGAGPRTRVYVQKEDTVGFLGLGALVGTEFKFEDTSVFLEADAATPMLTLGGNKDNNLDTFTFFLPKLRLGVNYRF